MELPPYVPKVQGDFLVHAVGILIADARIIGIGAGGSFVSGEMDDYSDVDLLVVVSDPSLCTDIAARIEIASRLGLLLTCFTGIHVGDLRLLICVYGPPVLKVDLKFVTADDLKHRVEDPVVLYDPISVPYIPVPISSGSRMRFGLGSYLVVRRFGGASCSKPRRY